MRQKNRGEPFGSPASHSLSGNGHPVNRSRRSSYLGGEPGVVKLKGRGSQAVTRLSISLNSAFGTRRILPALFDRRLVATVCRWLQIAQFRRPSMETDNSQDQAGS
jgi:hypothetical protein